MIDHCDKSLNEHHTAELLLFMAHSNICHYKPNLIMHKQLSPHQKCPTNWSHFSNQGSYCGYTYMDQASRSNCEVSMFMSVNYASPYLKRPQPLSIICTIVRRLRKVCSCANHKLPCMLHSLQVLTLHYSSSFHLRIPQGRSSFAKF